MGKGAQEIKHLIVVGNNPMLLLQVILSAHSHGKTKCIVVGDKESRAIRRSTLCSRRVEASLDGSDDDGFARTVNLLAEQKPGAILIPADCDAARITNRVRNRLKVEIIPIPDLSTLDMLDNKWTFYQFCIANGYNAPLTLYVGAKTDLRFDAIKSEIGLPFVLKPVNQAGSTGVHIVHSEAYYDEAIRNNDGYQYAPLIAQRYIAGADGGLSVLSIEGKVCAFAIQKYVKKSGIEFLSNAYLEEVMHKLCKASGYHGVVNLDVRIEEGTGTIYFTEANPRFWASTFAAVWAGLNFVAESMEHAARPKGVRGLTSGKFHERRHPLISPSMWPYLVWNKGERGRMARAMMFDLYILPKFIASLPPRIVAYAKRHAFKRPVTRPHT